MRVLWLSSVVLPEAAQSLGLASAHGGGWIVGQVNAVRATVQLTICTVYSVATEIMYSEVNGVTYVVVPHGTKEELNSVLEKVKPDLVHLWGSEYAPVSTLFSLCDPDHTLLSIQGLMGPCAEHLLDGVPDEYCHSNIFQRLIDRVVPAGLLDKEQKTFNQLAQKEAELFGQLRHVTGRTEWDREQLKTLAPNATYYTCNETLRASFYSGEWTGGPDQPVLFLSQGNYPLKGLHRLLQALPPIVQEFPGIHLKIAGWPPLQKGKLLNPIIEWVFPYQRYIKKLIHQLELEDVVTYTGPLDESEMRQQYLDSSIYLMCSSIENSPNSLGEAMMLGVPCIAAGVGGVTSILEDGEEGYLYDPADTQILTRIIRYLLQNPEEGKRIGKNARRRALKTHDAVANGEALLGIYNAMYAGWPVSLGADARTEAVVSASVKKAVKKQQEVIAQQEKQQAKAAEDLEDVLFVAQPSQTDDKPDADDGDDVLLVPKK